MNDKKIKRLILGTAQLGMQYGIANQIGQPDQKTATTIVETAWNAGINEFDTAQGYGDSELVLKRAFVDLKISNDVLVISKFSHQIDHLNEKIMEAELEKSLKRMNIPFIFGMMIHDEKLLEKWTEGLGEIFQKLVHSQKILKVGFSVYTPQKAIEALNYDGIDFVQVPSNVLDRRFEKAGVWELAKKKGKQVHIRSIFLQGLLLMNPNQIPDKMRYVVPIINRFIKFSKEAGKSRKELSMGYIKNAFPDSHALFGVDSVNHVKYNIEDWAQEYPADLTLNIRTLFSDVPENITNWNLWPKY